METKSFFFVAQEKFGCSFRCQKNGGSLEHMRQFDEVFLCWKSKKPVGQNKSLGDQSSTAFPSEAGLRKETKKTMVIGFPDIVIHCFGRIIACPYTPNPSFGSQLLTSWFEQLCGFREWSFLQKRIFARFVYEAPLLCTKGLSSSKKDLIFFKMEKVPFLIGHTSSFRFMFPLWC